MLRKIFPFYSESSFFNSFKIIFISEGFLASESALFTAKCLEFSNRLLETPPFNLTRINNNWLSIYTSFTPSNSSGPIINSPPVPNRTAFESSVDTSAGLITFNNSKINNYIANETGKDAGVIFQLSDYLGTGYPSMGFTGTLLVLLLPSLAGHPNGAELENNPIKSDFYFIATSLDGEWQQVIIRGVCKLLGLADEFELEGDDFLEPDNNGKKGILYFPNVQYFESKPTTLTSRSKWYRLFSVVQRDLPIEVHQKTGDVSEVDNTLSEYLVSYDKPAFYEGGSNYRTRVYRSTKDCLMRRRIGSTTLPLREKLVSLSPISSNYLKGVIL